MAQQSGNECATYVLQKHVNIIVDQHQHVRSVFFFPCVHNTHCIDIRMDVDFCTPPPFSLVKTTAKHKKVQEKCLAPFRTNHCLHSALQYTSPWNYEIVRPMIIPTAAVFFFNKEVSAQKGRTNKDDKHKLEEPIVFHDLASEMMALWRAVGGPATVVMARDQSK